MRLFLAILLDEDMKKTMLGCMDQLREQTTYAKFTSKENLHLTLAFLGETDRVDDIMEAVEEAIPTQPSLPDMTLTTAGAGHFGSIWFAGLNSTDAVLPKDRAKGSKRPPSALCCLADAIRQALSDRGFYFDDKPFRPHVTLAREVQSRRAPFIRVPKCEMKVQAISLMRSDRVDGRLTYTEIARKEL